MSEGYLESLEERLKDLERGQSRVLPLLASLLVGRTVFVREESGDRKGVCTDCFKEEVLVMFAPQEEWWQHVLEITRVEK